MDQGVPNLPLHCDSFVVSLGGLEKRTGKSKLSKSLIVYI